MNLGKPKAFPVPKRGANDNRLNLLLQKRGALLRDWRRINGLTLVQLADRVGVHVNTIASWEGGRVVIPAENLEKLIGLGFPEEAARLKVYGI